MEFHIQGTKKFNEDCYFQLSLNYRHIPDMLAPSNKSVIIKGRSKLSPG